MLDTKLIRPAYRNRINSIPQTVGCFSVFLRFKEKEVPYLNYNYYGYQGNTPWNCENYSEASWPKGFLYMHFCADSTPTTYASSGVILSYMKMEEVARWKGSSVGKRGEEYETFKRQKAEKLLDVVETHSLDSEIILRNTILPPHLPISTIREQRTEPCMVLPKTSRRELHTGCPNAPKCLMYFRQDKTSTPTECWESW